VLDRIEIELAHHGGNDNGKLPVTYDDFRQYGIDRDAIAPAIRENEALGFLKITERGRAGNREFRSPNKFGLTYRHWDRAKPTDEWRRLETIEDAEAIAQAARKQISSRGKPQVSVGETPTKNTNSPVGKTPTTAIVGKPRLLSISGVPDHMGGGATGTSQASFLVEKSHCSKNLTSELKNQADGQLDVPACAQCGLADGFVHFCRGAAYPRGGVPLHRQCRPLWLRRVRAHEVGTVPPST
jgi:hypothetical protein